MSVGLAETSQAAGSREVLSFQLGDEQYGIDILKVQEIRGCDAVTRIANMPEFIRGVIDLRGLIVPIVDMRIKFNLENADYSEFTVVIILSLEERVVGVVVDSVSDVMTLAQGQIKDVPTMGSAVDGNYLSGVGTAGDAMILLLDIERLMGAAPRCSWPKQPRTDFFKDFTMNIFNWSNLNIWKKLALAFASVIVIFSLALAITLLIGKADIDSGNLIADRLTPAQTAAINASKSLGFADDAGAFYVMERDDKRAETSLARYNTLAAAVDTYAAQAKSLADTPDQQADIEAFEKVWLAYKNDNEKAFSLRRAHDFERAQASYLDTFIDQALAPIATFNKSLQAQIDDETQRGNRLEGLSMFLGMALGALAAGFGILMAIVISRSIVRPLQNAVDVAAAIAQGDLTKEIGKRSGDETGTLLDAMSEMQERLKHLVGQVQLLVASANDGNFSVSVDMRNMVGYQSEIAEGLNLLMLTTQGGLSDVAGVLAGLAEGDLTRRIDRDYKGTFGQLRDDSNATVESLTELVTQIRESVDLVYRASREIASGNSNLSQRTEEQASSLEETAASMEELTSTVKQNDENARQANQLAIGASDIASKGGEVVRQVVDTMASINDSARKIVDIISVIDGIAFQTNILALNAAVEAARAGEQGRGFAVVAGEVRNLAQRSAGAAKEIKALISNSVDKTEAGSRQADSAGATMTEIVDSVKRVTDIMAEIAAASREQLSGIEQVNAAVMQMDQATQQNAALVEEAAASASSLEEQAAKLVEGISTFKVANAKGGRRRSEVPPAESQRPRGERAHARQPVPALRNGNGHSKERAIDDAGDWERF